MASDKQEDRRSAVSLDLRIDIACDRFEREWAAGSSPSIVDYLQAALPADQEYLFGELLLLEIELRARQGEKAVSLESLESRFPDHKSIVRAVFQSSEDIISQWTIDKEVSNDVSNPRSGMTTHLPGQSQWQKEGDGVPSMIGPYQIAGQLGEGGMGTVYRGVHTLIDREVAIKVLRSDVAFAPQAVSRFIREAQTCVGLIHPNIVTTYEIDKQGDTVYMVMELVEGDDLSALVKKHGPLTDKEAVQTIKQVADGLAHAHAKGIIHRDIKPHNIIVSESGNAKLVDLGLARIVAEDVSKEESNRACQDRTSRSPNEIWEDQTKTGSLLGTLAYMAPEQAIDPRQVDPRSDIYSLGCTLYFLLAGQHAFVGRSAEDVIRKHHSSDYRKLVDVQPSVPATLASIVHRMMAANPSERFKSAADVAHTLDTWLYPEINLARLTVHEAVFIGDRRPALFINATNLSYEVDILHSKFNCD